MLSQGLRALDLPPSAMLELSKEQLRLQIPNAAKVLIAVKSVRLPSREGERNGAVSVGRRGVPSSGGWGTC